ncbi:MAG TPA: hypothetical protein VHY20_02610, partial [Pirellulales bacterium]|nr:hypothetical protein [Pirellulales bacterium]
MREASSPQPVGSSEPAWRGKPDDAAPLAQRQWQQETQRQQDPATIGRGVWFRLRVGLLVVLFVGLFCWFVYSVSFAPIQTPLVVLDAARYEWPLPPNAWAEEDLNALASLDGQNVLLARVACQQQSAAEALNALDAQLYGAAGGPTPPRSLIIYISMLGTLDSAGVPCLIPPSASPLESETWLSVPKLLERIKQQTALANCDKLLVLDCNRLETDWQRCVLYNGFADRLSGAVRAAQVPRLAVLNSAAPSQRGWTSSELEASVFGYYLRLGLSGLADSQTGNGDRQISLRELHDYLVDRVDTWAVYNRAAHQQPILLLSPGVDDFPVAWALNRRSQNRLSAPPQPVRQVVVSDDERGRLWRKREEFARLAPERSDPLGWRDFQQRLVWLEQATAAGKAYSASARNMAAQLTSLAATISERAASHDRSGPTRPVNWFHERSNLPLAAHSLPMARYLGQASGAAGNLAGLNRVAGPEAVADLVSQLDRLGNSQLLVERQFLRLLGRYDMPRLL